MRSREVEVTIKIKYTIEEDEYLNEAYGVGNIEHLSLGHVTMNDGNPKIISITELVAMSDETEFVDDSWKLGSVIGTRSS